MIGLLHMRIHLELRDRAEAPVVVAMLGSRQIHDCVVFNIAPRGHPRDLRERGRGLRIPLQEVSK